MKNVTLDVEGMMCEGCSRNVERALGDLSGVRRADVSLDDERARLTVEDNVDEAELVRAVDAAGYSAEVGSD